MRKILIVIFVCKLLVYGYENRFCIVEDECNEW